MNYDTTYNITEHNLNIVVDNTGDIFINTSDYSTNNVGIITEVCCLNRDQVRGLISILDKAVDRSKEIANGK
jgi:hypothetical protein